MRINLRIYGTYDADIISFITAFGEPVARMYIVAMLDAYASGRDFVVGRDIPDIRLSAGYDHSKGNGIRCNLSVSEKKYPDACRMLANVKPKCSGILIKNIIRFYLNRSLTNSLLISSRSTVISSPAEVLSTQPEKITKEEEKGRMLPEILVKEIEPEESPHAETKEPDDNTDTGNGEGDASELAVLFGGLKFD